MTAKVLDSHLDANGAGDSTEAERSGGGRESDWRGGGVDVVQLKCSAR